MNKKVLALSLSFFLVLSSLFLGGFTLAYHAGAVTGSNNNDEMTEDEDELEDEDLEDEEEDEDEDEDEDEVEDITEVELDEIPFRFGKFELGGTVTATDIAASTITVNGLAVDVSGARIHRASVRQRRGENTALSSVLVGDRVRMSGTIENGVIKAERVAVVESSTSGRGGSKLLEALRAEIREQIQAILQQIKDLREQLKAQQGES